MFKSRGEGNVVYKCSIRLLDDSFLELEFQVDKFDLLCILEWIARRIPRKNQFQMFLFGVKIGREHFRSLVGRFRSNYERIEVMF